MAKRLLLICILFLSVSAAHADDSAQANRLFVEAMKLIQTAETEQSPPNKLALLENAVAKLNQIVNDDLV